MLIDGARVDAANGGVLEVENPATGEVIATVPLATAADFDTAIKAARDGARTWAATPVHERVAVFRTFVGLLEANAERLAALLISENGKPLQQARDEIAGCVRLFRSYTEEALRLYGVTVPGDAQPGLERDLILVQREPFGVLGAIIPFNFPLDLFTHKVAPALATGNAVIAKPAEVAPLAVLEMAQLLLDAGVPGNVMQTITGTGREVGSWLASSDAIDLVSFTGSTDVGVEIAVNAARNLNPTFLELGGNDALIVLPDADIDAAVTQAVQSRTLCNGQTCCATKRLLVHRSIADDVTGALVERLGSMVVGDPAEARTEIGPLINENAAQRASGHVAVAQEQGAKLALGDGAADAAYFRPVVLTDVPREADIARDTEVFAPTLPVILFADDTEAVAIANQTRYGLNAAVFSPDLSRALRAARHIQAGTVVINGGTAYRPDAIPFGGYKSSGLGREGLITTLQEFTQPKTISIRSLY